MRYVERRDPDGKLRRIAVVDGTPPNLGLKKRKRKCEPFEARWVKLLQRWIKALRNSKSVNTHQLALEILSEAFKQEPKPNYRGGEIILSSTVVVGMPRCARLRAARELVQLGLIKIEQKGNQAIRVIHIYY